VLAQIIFLLILILINAFFAASEISLISLNDNKIRLMADEGHKKAVMLKKLLDEPSKFLATIQIGITLAGFLASALAAESFSERLVYALQAAGLNISAALLKTLSLIVITLVMSYFSLVFGELVPKRIGMKKAQPIAMFAVGPLNFLGKLTSPFVRLLTGSTNFTVRLFGIDTNEEDDNVTE
jgi:putative hemolysin